ncbi:MAG: sensor histidine kinase [Blastocatellia bacterium]
MFRRLVSLPPLLADTVHRRNQYVLAALPLFLLLPSLCSAAFAQYRFDHWTTDNGLPQNSVRDLVQTRDGYVWITTLGGLARFDGKRLTVFTKVTQPEFTGNRFTVLHEDRAGHLWIGTEEGGVLRYRDGVFTSWTTKDGLPGNYIDRIDEDEAGAILIFTDQGAAQWRDGSFTKLPLTSQAVVKSGSAPAAGYGRYLNFALRPDAAGYQLFNRGRWEHLPKPSGVPAGAALPFGATLSPLIEDARGRLWFNFPNASGYYEWRGGHWETTMAPPTLGNPFYLDQQGRYWTPHKSGVSLEKDGKATPLPLQGVNWSYRVLEDREGNIWLGTYDKGLLRLIEQAVTFLSLPGRPNERYVYPLLEDRNGNVWISAGEAGLTRYVNGQLTRFPLLNTKGAWDISSFYEDRDGSLLIGTYLHGMTRFRNNEWRIDQELLAHIKGRVDVIFRDRQGDLWFGGQNGLDRQTVAGEWVHYGPDNGLPMKHVKTMLEDASGRLWIGGYGCLALWHNGQFTTWTKNEGLIADRVISLYEDREHVLWVGTSDGGLYRFRPAAAGWNLTRYTTREGMHSNEVKQIFEDERGYFWIGSERGIYRLHKQELNDFAEGRNASITSISFGKADGLLSTDCIGGFQPAGFKARDGRLWFPTMEGVAIVDPRRVSMNSIPPPVALEDCLLDRRNVSWRQGLQINPGQENLEISYTGLSFNRAEQVRFRYRLDGLEADWIEAGTRRTAYYSHLPPGDYTFKVIAANSDGVWNTEGQSMRITVLPPFYRTWWFLTLIGLLVCGLAFSGYWYRVRQLEREQQAQRIFARRLIESQEAERKRIAAELHDSLGQHLLVIKNRAVIGDRATPEASTAREQFDEITVSATQAISEVRAISHNLRPVHLERLGLTAVIEEMIERVAQSSGLQFSTDIEALDGWLSKEDEIHLFRILQESANNILKHAQATKAYLEIWREGDELRVTVRDNGRGYDANASSPRRGLGLTSIGERARMLGGTQTITTAPGAGTTIELRIPISESGRTAAVAEG